MIDAVFTWEWSGEPREDMEAVAMFVRGALALPVNVHKLKDLIKDVASEQVQAPHRKVLQGTSRHVSNLCIDRMFEMMSNARQNVGKHVKLSIACARCQRQNKIQSSYSPK